MCVCMYVCGYLFGNVCICVCVFASIHLPVCTYTRVHMHVSVVALVCRSLDTGYSVESLTPVISGIISSALSVG